MLYIKCVTLTNDRQQINNNSGVVILTKAKAKSGIGRGTGKKGWNRWQTAANKKKTKPYVSKGTKRPSGETDI
jgi:hypothetical protein